MGAVFAHSRSKITTCRRFRAFFATVSTKQKWVLVLNCENGWNMDLPLHSRVKSTVNCVDGSRWKPSKATKDANISGPVLASWFWDAQDILFINYLKKGRAINSKYYIAWLVPLKEEIAIKRPQKKEKKVLFHQDNTPCQKSIANNGKTIWIALQIVPAPTLFPRSAPVLQRLLVVCRSQKNTPGKTSGSNDEVISETAEYFEAKDKSFYKKGNELFEKHRN